MAGCSVVLLAIVFSPLMLVIGVAALIAGATIEFVHSLAFPFLLGSLAFGAVAFVDAVRILWSRYRAGNLRELRPADLTRPAVLCAVACVLFAVMCALAGSMLVTWVNEVRAAGAA
ncbi:MAG: hypothetical protein IJ203_07830 [Atopobiaceae bacterium]|nr:hypothetical protein [Atopobiaceae bacterium]